MNTPPNGHVSNGRRTFFPGGPRKTFDPQIVLEGTLKEGERSDYIVFRMRLLIVDLTFIVTLPEEGKNLAPVYVKFKIDRSQSQPPGTVKVGGFTPSYRAREEEDDPRNVRPQDSNDDDQGGDDDLDDQG